METKGKGTMAVSKRETTISEKFTSMVIREYSSLAGELDMTPYQRRLAQHLFIKVDVTLRELEAKRTGDRQPIVWANINMQKLALDAVHRIDLGLDALIPNHISPIPYWNTKGGKYDLDLRVGYVGKDYYRRRMAIEEPVDIIYELVYSTDTFEVIKRSVANDVEGYNFKINNPFDRGEIVGGFGYIMYEDISKNRLVIVTEKDFQRSRSLAKANNFWQDNPVEMRYKTLIHRTTDKLNIDPRKVNESYLAVESAEDEEIAAEIEEKANKEVIDVDIATGEITETRIIEPTAEKPIGVATPKPSPSKGEEKPAKEAPKAKPIKAQTPKPQRDVSKILTIADARLACFQDYDMQPKEFYAELGVDSENEIAQSPQNCYLQIAAVRMSKEGKTEPEF